MNSKFYCNLAGFLVLIFNHGELDCIEFDVIASFQSPPKYHIQSPPTVFQSPTTVFNPIPYGAAFLIVNG